ncbi:MAG TPA: hypothetical protein VF815_40350 [Myxococcaceae bacterium]
MSQLASAYAVSLSQLEALAELSLTKSWEDFWRLLQQDAREIGCFEHSGHVINVVLVELEERGVRLPLDTEQDELASLSRHHPSLLACLAPGEGPGLASAIEALGPADDEWPLMGMEFQCPPAILRAGRDFLLQCVRAPLEPNERLLLFVG